jgi:hypothetical protein
MMTQMYALAVPIGCPDGRVATGVLVDDYGAWLGAVVPRIGNYDLVVPLEDGGENIPVPDDIDWFPAATLLA